MEMHHPKNVRNVPSVFQCIDGSEVKNKEEWFEKRRPEILKMFQEEEYGKLPDFSDVEVSIRLVDSRQDTTFMDGQAIRRTVEVEAIRQGRHFIFNFVVFIPANVEHPVPAFVTVVNRGIKDSDPCRHFISPFYPAETIVSRGYACAAFRTQEVAPDYDEGFTTCFHRLFPEYTENRPKNAWGAITAWSWAASRIMDYFEQDPFIDEKKVAVVGHSRGGKTALWTAAQDERFAMAISSCAGNSGDAISRGPKGSSERIENIVGRFPYWFAENYRKYAGHEDELPFDQHMLISLIAPRCVYTTSRTFDGWADQAGQFESLVQATPVFELLGVHGLTTFERPKAENPLRDGNIAYHMKTGNHDLDEYDWEQFMDYCDDKYKE